MANKALYNISLKIIIEREGEFLILTNDEGKFDLPGGRINDDEHRMPLREILERELSEELGGGFKVLIGEPIMQFRRIFEDDDLYVFIVVFSGKAILDNIVISEEHNGWLWLKPDEIVVNEDKFYSKEEYEAFRNFFFVTRKEGTL